MVRRATSEPQGRPPARRSEATEESLSERTRTPALEANQTSQRPTHLARHSGEGRNPVKQESWTPHQVQGDET